MKKLFNKIHKDVLELALLVSKKDFKNITEDDLDVLAESLNILEDMYETLYDEVFVEVENSKTVCKGTEDQL
jgi:hypothetical protein